MKWYHLKWQKSCCFCQRFMTNPETKPYTRMLTCLIHQLVYNTITDSDDNQHKLQVIQYKCCWIDYFSNNNCAIKKLLHIFNRTTCKTIKYIVSYFLLGYMSVWNMASFILFWYVSMSRLHLIEFSYVLSSPYSHIYFDETDNTYLQCKND